MYLITEISYGEQLPSIGFKQVVPFFSHDQRPHSIKTFKLPELTVATSPMIWVNKDGELFSGPLNEKASWHKIGQVH